MKKKILFDIKAWLIVALLMPLINKSGTLYETVTGALYSCLLIMALFYPHQLLIKHYFSKKKWVQYGVGILLLIVVGALVATLFSTEMVADKTQRFWSNGVTLTVLVLLSTAVNYAYKGIILQVQFEKIKRQQIEAELKLLQSQVNPHFLFNTLNNIYAQNLEHHEEANEMVLQLADLMRYQIESAKKNEVSIQDEIEFIENYLALEKKRLTARIKTSFTAEIDAQLDLTIPPMLFIPFIENAYKHGIGAEGDSFIPIYLSIKSDLILFKIENSISLNFGPTGTGAMLPVIRPFFGTKDGVPSLTPRTSPWRDGSARLDTSAEMDGFTNANPATAIATVT